MLYQHKISMIKSINNTITDALLHLTGIGLIILYLYMRFILKRMPRNLYFADLQSDSIIVDYLLIILCISSILIMPLILYTIIKRLRHKDIKIPKNIVIVFLIKILYYILEALSSVKKLILDKIPDSYQKLRDLSLYFYKIYGYKSIKLCLIFIIIPYSVITVMFFIDVFYFFKFKYFYYSLYLLIIPLCYHIWLKLIAETTQKLKEIEKYLDIEYSLCEDGRDDFTFMIKEEYLSEIPENTFIYFTEEYISLIPLKGFLEQYYDIENHYKLRLSLVTYLIYWLGWIYIFTSNYFYFNNCLF